MKSIPPLFVLNSDRLKLERVSNFGDKNIVAVYKFVEVRLLNAEPIFVKRRFLKWI